MDCLPKKWPLWRFNRTVHKMLIIYVLRIVTGKFLCSVPTFTCELSKNDLASVSMLINCQFNNTIQTQSRECRRRTTWPITTLKIGFKIISLKEDAKWKWVNEKLIHLCPSWPGTLTRHKHLALLEKNPHVMYLQCLKYCQQLLEQQFLYRPSPRSSSQLSSSIFPEPSSFPPLIN